MSSRLFSTAFLARGLRRKSKRRRQQERRPRLAIDQLESRIALAITTPLSISSGVTVGSFFDAPTGPADLGDFVTVSIEGTKGTVIFNDGAGVLDGTDIQSIQILNASPDFQLTFNATIRTSSPVPYGSDGIVQLGKITTSDVIRGINTVRGPVTNVAAPWEVETSAIHLYTFNDGTTSDLIGGADGTLFNGATISGGQLVLAENPGPATGAGVQYMSMPAGVLPNGSTAATFELWFTASSSTGTWGRGFDLGLNDQNYVVFTPLQYSVGSRATITQGGSATERMVTGPSYNDDTQHLATVVVDDAANLLSFYVDGTPIGSVSLEGQYLSGIEAVNNFLGRSQFADAGFIGSINQFAIYDKALSLAEISANYLAGPISGPLTPVGFTQSSAGSATLELAGDQRSAFPVLSFVCVTPLTPPAAAVFRTVNSVSYDSGTNVTTIGLDAGTGGSTTAGVLTLAETRQPEFWLTSFVGVNFSNRNLKEGGGLFVDVVTGDVDNDNLGILLSEGLLAYSSIGIRKELAAEVFIGTSRTASAEGRVFIESATPESAIFVGPKNSPTAQNSKFQLIGGAGPFGADVTFFANFNGVVNIGAPATGTFLFRRNVGALAVLDAQAWSDVRVEGNFAGKLNSVSTGLKFDVAVEALPPGNVSLSVRGNVAATARVNSASDLLMTVDGSVTGAKLSSSNDIDLLVLGSVIKSTLAANGVTLAVRRDALNVKVVADEADASVDVGGNFSGAVQSGSGNLFIDVGGSVVKTTGAGAKGSSFLTGGDAEFNVSRSFDGGLAVRDLRYFVGGNVSAASRIVAQRVTDWNGEDDAVLNGDSANFRIGGRLDGIVNVVDFDAAPDYQTVTILGSGAGSSARFYVDRFNTDQLVFNGNFAGNMRVGDDLVADLQFNGNVDRITIVGRVGSYFVNPLDGSIAPYAVTIDVAGRLLYLNSNSYFEATTRRVAGQFWNDATKSGVATGTLTTGSYVTVVPNLQVVPAPPPAVYTVPSVPLSFSANPIAPPTSAGGPSVSTSSYAAIKVSFSAPASNGGLPVLAYEYSTNALAGASAAWRAFDNPAQGPGTDIQLTCDSAGGAWIDGNTYSVSVRALNAMGAGPGATYESVTVTLPSG